MFHFSKLLRYSHFWMYRNSSPLEHGLHPLIHQGKLQEHRLVKPHPRLNNFKMGFGSTCFDDFGLICDSPGHSFDTWNVIFPEETLNKGKGNPLSIDDSACQNCLQSNTRSSPNAKRAWLFLWPTVKELIWFTISLSTFNFRLINSSCSAAVDRERNSSEKTSSSTVEIGRSPSCLGLGLNSQHRPVNFPYARRSEYSASRSPWFGCQSKVVYPGFVGGNISAIDFREISGAFGFFHKHSTSVRLKL